MEDVLLFNVRQAAKMLGVSARTIHSLVKAKAIPYVRLGTGRGRILFPKKMLEEWLSQRAVRPSSVATE